MDKISQDNIIRLLKEGKGLTIAEISDRLGITRNNVWLVLKKLVKQGAVERIMERTNVSNMLKYVYYINKSWQYDGKKYHENRNLKD